MHSITREIQIDMGHRVPDHLSKCRNIHGHRYVIQATLEGPIIGEGNEHGMVMDFGFIKEDMMMAIDNPFDHGLCLWYQDQMLKSFHGWKDRDRGRMSYTLGGTPTKVYVMEKVPTAENLAELWFYLLNAQFEKRGQPYYNLLKRIRVYETPNCWADYVHHDEYDPMDDMDREMTPQGDE